MSKRKEKARRKAERKAMRKRNRKLTPEQRRARRKRRQETMIIFVNGRQKRVPRYSEPLIEGIPVDEFIRRNADEIWYWQEEDFPALYELQQRRAESCLSPFDEFPWPQPEMCDEYEAPAPWDAESFDDERLLDDECADDPHVGEMRRPDDEGYCPDFDRPPPPVIPEIDDQSDQIPF